MKQGEIDYLKAIGPAGRRHAERKPFSDPRCGSYLIAMGQILDLMPPPPAKVLDMGCGTGWTSMMIARRGHEVLGVDISPDMVDSATQLALEEGLNNARFEVGDYEMQRPSAEFDVVLFFDSLHHAEDEASALASAFAALKPGGLCIASEPGKGHHATEASRSAVERFGVNEKDMPPTHVCALAERLGFQTAVYPHMNQIARLLGPAPLEVSGPSWKQKLIDLRYLRPLLVLALALYLKKDNGIIVMTK